MKANAEDFYYFKSDENGFDVLKKEKYEFYNSLKTEDKIYILLKNLFNNSQSMINYMPEGSKIISLSLENGELIINVNENVKNYGGGANFEIKFIEQILFNVFQFEDIENVTLLINGKVDYLPEGSVIYKMVREKEQTRGEF